MQTHIHPELVGRPDILEADEILRSCVHCGFCTATCPTYQLLGDELDGPRGRIYLIKNLLEDNAISAKSVDHLDRCLTCRACETTCPSGVRYGRLLDIGKELVAEKSIKPSMIRRSVISMLRFVVPKAALFGPMLRLGQYVRPLMPAVLARHMPYLSRKTYSVPAVTMPAGSVLVLQGCVQKIATPQVNQGLAKLLATQNIVVEMLAAESCCGSLDYHLAAHTVARERMCRLIDQIYPRLSQVDAIVSTASGCGVTIKDYPEILHADGEYSRKAEQIVAKLVDVSELLATYTFDCEPARVAFHSPCTLQHGQKITGVVERILQASGFELTAVQDAHLCCGSAGTYSILQPEISQRLLVNKVASLVAQDAEFIATANIGCHLHLQSGTAVPVVHWVELLADRVRHEAGDS
jgi:glycolate oxidase iron-sulfur subunit